MNLRTRIKKLKPVLRLVERCLAVIGFGFIAYHCCFQSSRIVSPSMSPTLEGERWHVGDRVLTENVSYWFRNPSRWEVITFRSQDGDIVMKRVVAFPGERVSMALDGTISINGKVVKRPNKLDTIRYFPIGNLFQGKTYECVDGYYVLGDDSRDSDDSRYIGVIGDEQLIGRSWLIMSPMSRFGMVNSF